MRKKLLPMLALSVVSCLLIAAGCNVASGPQYSTYEPNKPEGDGGFDFPSNSFAADVVLDGYLNDDRWNGADVISLGSWDNSDVESETYGAIVENTLDYANTKRGVIKMFRGEIGLHFGFEVKDGDVSYFRLENGDAAIWTDNVLLNLCTAIDGGTIPMSDDYYFLVTAFGNYCFRRGANAAGMWGAWSGVLDYETAVHYAEDGETVTGFGVELVVPYTQIGIEKDSPVGLTFRSCDRVSETGNMIEREWWYKDGVHHFNTPNEYVIWGNDNNLYSYYDYQMPAVTVQGTAVDYISGNALAGVTLAEGVTTDANGNFKIENVNANEDLVLTASGGALLGEQTYTVPRDKMRVLKGGTLTITPAFLTETNKITQTVKGKITSLGEVAGATVKVGDAQTTVAADGSYSLECEFDRTVMTMSVTAAGSTAAYETEIGVLEAVSGEVVRDIELPVMSKLLNFGEADDIETYLGWTNTGLYVRMQGVNPTNGYGVAYSADGATGKVVLYHTFGTMCVTDFVNQSWNYAPPASFGAEAEQRTDAQGRKVFTFVIPYETLGIEYGVSIKIAPFEYTSAGPFAWFADENGKSYPFGNIDLLETYPTLSADGSVTFVQPTPPPTETVLSTYSIGKFGKTNATALFEKVDGETDGIRVTITYTTADGFWGFGVMFGDSVNGITQLYVPDYGTIDHRTYGNWTWNGNYLAASALGVTASGTTVDGVTTLTLFYSYETLQSANYGLNINADSKEIGLQMFEYVMDASGNLYGCYNCINVDGNPLAFDTGVANFVRWVWQEVSEPVSTEYTYEDLGEHNIDVKLEKLDTGILITYTAAETDNLFGYGICLDLPDGAQDISVLYATTGNIAKHNYGDWLWNYQLPETVGATASRTTANGVTTATVFFSFETLGIDADTASIGICLFEVVNANGAQYGIYNCMQNNGAEVVIDGGVNGFVTWNIA